MITITPSITIDDKEIEETFIRAGGPGGQNVNKVSSAVQLRFNARNSPSLDSAVKNRLRKLAGRRMTIDGVIIIEAKRYRSQERNREDALTRLIDLIRKATIAPTPRRKTRPAYAAKQKRMDNKRRRSSTKQNRATVRDDD